VRGRGAAAVLALALARTRAAPGRALLAAAGVAVAVALLAGAAGGGAIAGERAAQRLLAGLPAADQRVALASTGRLPASEAHAADRALAATTGEPVTRAVVLRPVRLGPHGTAAQIAAIAPAARWLRLESGRLPRGCTPRRCEVVQVAGAPLSALPGAGRELDVVGRARLTSAIPLGFRPRAGTAAGPESQGAAPLFVGGDPAGLERLPALAAVSRTHAWSAPLDLAGVASWDLGAAAARVARMRADLEATGGWTVSAPLHGLDAARARADTARERVGLVAAAAAALLVAFAVVAAGALGRDLEAERRRLERRGARRWQLALLGLAEAAGPAAAGVVLGAAAGIAVTWLRARGAGLDPGALTAHALLTPAALAAASACWLAATLLLASGAAVRGRAAGRVGDALAIAAVAGLALALARGDVGAGALARGADPVAALLPALAGLAFGLALVRLAPPLLRGLGRAARPAPALLRTAALGVARSPRQAALTIAFVAVCAGLAMFAAGYRATLERGQRDEAAFRVPVDVTIAAGADFVSPARLASPHRWAQLAGGARVLPVVRQSGSVPRGATRVTLPVLGVPARGLGDLRGWERTGASAPATALAARLDGDGDATAAGTPVRIPRRAAAVALPATARGDALRLTLHVRGRDGRLVAIDLGRAGPAPRRLTAPVPGAARGGRIVALEATADGGLLATAGHQRAEGGTGADVVAGRLTLGALRAGGELVRWDGWTAGGALRPPRPAGPGVRVPYAFDRPGSAVLRPPGSAVGAPIPVLADRATAAAAGPRGRLPLRVDGVPLTARVVGSLARLPGVGPDAAGFVVADRARLSAALDAARPGAGATGELWLAVTPAQERRLAVALDRPRLDGLTVTSRRAVEAQLRGDPLARELLGVLAAAALAGGLLAVGGLLLATWVAVRDESAELYDLEAQGAPPRTLRAVLWLRAMLLAALGAAGGVALGALLGALVAETVQATAATTVPVPPLTAVLPWTRWAAGLAVGALLAAAAVAIALARAFSGPVPRRPRSAAP
jgi:hypothetical protein